MKQSKLFAAVLLIFILGCNGNSVGPSNGTTSGHATLSTTLVNNNGVGFSFSKGDTVVISNSSIIRADISTLVQTNDAGAILGVFLSAIPFRQAFRLMYAATDPDSAKIYFTNLKEFTDSTYSDLAIPVIVNQVWVVKTHDDKYAKILITNTMAYIDSTVPSAPTMFGKVTFDWTYQPNGERTF